ncbi:hypothetical protein TREVI0001_1251 [Treponema vincentii ATCC 35580]|uniref:Uncharacterized protein n=1 Tax=Treponema vincentii ATCC 35580 TaxID=596324 RepID=C8PS85_9SPIR|nr:hypothetical protein TREVI0001_1251 [Treponema vincentii ATCC 35580]
MDACTQAPVEYTLFSVSHRIGENAKKKTKNILEGLNFFMIN